MMTAREFDRFLRFRLCWTDGTPTSSSHAGQRQCPRCRRKWSYEVLSRRWVLAGEFCKGSSRRKAAREAGTDVHTAGRHYQQFYKLLAAHFSEPLRTRDWRIHVDPESLAECCRKAGRTSDQEKREQFLVQLCLQEMQAEARMELLFKVAFKDHVQGLVISAVMAQTRGQPESGVPAAERLRVPRTRRKAQSAAHRHKEPNRQGARRQTY